jgi:hypothetical protein
MSGAPTDSLQRERIAPYIFISTLPQGLERDTICMNFGPIAVPECGGVDG